MFLYAIVDASFVCVYYACLQKVLCIKTFEKGTIPGFPDERLNSRDRRVPALVSRSRREIRLWGEIGARRLNSFKNQRSRRSRRSRENGPDLVC